MNPFVMNVKNLLRKKIKTFEQNISLFRQNKAAYREFLSAIGYNNEEGGIQNIEEVDPPLEEAPPNCNNWRFYLCGVACALSAPAPPVFAACLLLCIAEFCTSIVE